MIIEEGGKKVSIQSIMTNSPAESGKTHVCRNLNTDFFKAVIDTMRNYTEAQSDYEDNLITDPLCRLQLFKQPFMTSLIVNQYQRSNQIKIFQYKTKIVDNMSIQAR